MSKIKDEYLRSFLFGFEDALVSTTGMVIGVSIGTQNRDFILLAAFVTVAVEAVSMAAGEFLSDEAVHELDKSERKDNTFVSALVMFSSYVIGGIIPVAPIIFLPHFESIIASMICAFIGLFILGFIKGKIVKGRVLRSALEMLLIGGIATIIGVGVGFFLKI